MKSSPWRQQKNEKKLSFRKAMVWIFFSTLFVSGSAALAILYYFHVEELQRLDNRYNITAIKQEGKEKGRLDTSYLAELLLLSADKKINLIGYHTDAAEMRLKTSPMIECAKVKKLKPNALLVEYKLRKPVFQLINYENAAVDKRGVILPIHPFFENTSLTELCLGDLPDNTQWGSTVPQEHYSFALQFVQMFKNRSEEEGVILKRIDLAKMHAPSLGEREVVVSIAESENSDDWLLRLSPKELEFQLREFFTLRDHLLKSGARNQPEIIDLRIPRLAFTLQ